MRIAAGDAARTLVRRALELLSALVVAGLVSRLVVSLVSRLPFVHPSWLPAAVWSALAAAGVVVVGWLLLRRRTGPRTLWALGTVGPALLASGQLSFVLHGTPHYLFGLGGDQVNRVSYVTRFADSPVLADPFLADAAPFYPPQWFWVGGRLAALTGAPGWEFYKPYSIVTMGIAGAIAFVAWRWLVPTRVAVLLGLVTTVVGVHLNAYEPYSWILVCLLPQVVAATFLLCHDGIRRTPAWSLAVAVGAYLGWAALDYTLIAGFAAGCVGLVVLGHLWLARRDRSAVVSLVARLLAVASISAAIALLFWHRYLGAVLTGAATEKSVAHDFAPESGSHFPLPMLETSATGALCLLGTVWLLATVWPDVAGRTLGRGASALRARVGQVGAVGDPDDDEPVDPATAALLARTFGVLVVAVLGWYALSGLRSVTGHTLLPFRTIPVLTLALALSGVLGALALVRWAVHTTPADDRARTRFVAVVVAALCAVQLVQHASEEDVQFAAAARATPGPPSDVLDAIDQMTPGRQPSDLVVLTADPTLTAWRPYFTFLPPAEAYSAPTGRYKARLDEVRSWAGAPTSADLGRGLTDGPFRGPDVLVLDRRDTGELVFPATINVMPLEHNNIGEPIVFRATAFDDPALFDSRSVGARQVIVRR